MLQEDKYVYGYCASVMSALMGAGGCGGLQIWLAMVERDKNKHLVMNRSINAPIIPTKNHINILNLYKDSLLVYDTAGGFVNAIPITFHKDLEIIHGIHYKNIDFFYDGSTDQVFFLERKERGWVLFYLDINTGKIQEEVPLPDFPGMTKIGVNNNAVYFLYPEKKYPYYTRLYRYQLD